MSFSDLELPNMRAELVYYLTWLWDREFQDRVWVKCDGTYAPFNDVIHLLYDDTSLSENPSRCIGWFLLNETEADAIRAVTANIDLLVERHGWQDTDAQHTVLPEWPAVMEAARHAYDLISPGTPSVEEAIAALAEKRPRANEERHEN